LLTIARAEQRGLLSNALLERSAIRSRFKPRTDAAWSLADVAALSFGVVIARPQYADSHAGSVRDVGSHAA
jgi:hypothetical protein